MSAPGRIELTAALLTVTCHRPIEPGFAPFVTAPVAELGDNDAKRAPTLVCLGKDYWRLAVAVRGLVLPLDPEAFTVGVRAVEPVAFKQGRDIRIEDKLDVSVQVTPARQTAAMHLHYYSGWPEVTARIFDHGRVREIALTPAGAGRTAGERCWQGELPSGEFGRDWGFVLCGPGDAIDRAPGGGSYRPRGTVAHLADGEIFPADPPRRRSPPRIETITCAAPEMDHTFVVHVVLPREFDVEPQRTYPLVYLNDGQNQFTDRGAFGGWHTDSIAARLMREGRLADCVLACVEMHADRNRAYFPEGTLTTAIGQADVYTELLAGRLFEVLRRRYRLTADEPLTIIGSSNGAIHALTAGLTRPDRFAAIGCLSYARLRPERNFRQIEALPAVPFRRISIDFGHALGRIGRRGKLRRQCRRLPGSARPAARPRHGAGTHAALCVGLRRCPQRGGLAAAHRRLPDIPAATRLIKARSRLQRSTRHLTK